MSNKVKELLRETENVYTNASRMKERDWAWEKAADFGYVGEKKKRESFKRKHWLWKDEERLRMKT